MHRFHRLLFAALVFLTWTMTQACAAETEPDERLKQTITLDCVNTRLHTAIEQIAAPTKVTINPGISKDDWKTRDVPILVCARGIPLGNLLEGLADTAHLLWSGSKGDDGVLKYRLWRDRKWQDQLDAYKEAKSAARTALANYDWDVLTKIKDLPESDLEDRYGRGNGDSPDEVGRLDAKAYRALSNAVAGLGPQMKSRVLDGEEVLLTVDAAPDSIRPYVTEALSMFLAASDAADVRDGRPAKTASIDERLKGSWLAISYNGVLSPAMVNPGDLGVRIGCGGGMSTKGGREFLSMLGKKGKELPARPEIPKAHFDTDKLDSRYVELKLSEPGGPTFLDKNVKIEPPKDKKKPTYSDLLHGVSEAIGYSIVAEGCAARNVRITTPTYWEKLPTMFGHETSVREILNFAQCPSNYEDWYVDEQSKLIIGRNRDWLMRLDALVPEKIIIDLQKKLKGEGVGLDDLQPLIGLTGEQLDDWIDRSPEAPEVEAVHVRPAAGSLLGLYFSLGPRERTLIKSGKSVSLIGVDQAWMRSLLRRQEVSMFESGLMIGYPKNIIDKVNAAYFRNMQALESDNTPTSVSLRLDKMPSTEGKHQYVFFVESADSSGLRIAESVGFLPVRAPQPKEDKQVTK